MSDEPTHSQREPQLEPADHILVILQDHGPRDGGWGPAAAIWPGRDEPSPLVYTGSSPIVENTFRVIAEQLARGGKATILARFTRREDVAVFGR